MSTTKRQSIFSRLSSSASSIKSNISSSSVPEGCRDYNRYAKDGKGYDFNLSYPYSTSSSSSSSTKSSAASASEMPVGARDFKLRYAKDGKGHDFAESYAYAPTNYAMDLGIGGTYIVSDVPRGSSHLANKNIRYAWHQGRQGSA